MAAVAFANAAPSVDPADLEAAAEKIRTQLRTTGRAEVADS
jgi:hypothetical protein